MRKYLYLLVCLLIASSTAFSAIDSVIVQTFSFDSLYKRQGIFKFTSGNDTYRKILMEYRLKCDTRTAWDKYNCGEWDYLTYNQLFKPTGIFDSNLVKNNYTYKLNYKAVDTFNFSKTPGFTKYNLSTQKRVVTNFVKDSFSLELNPGTKSLNFNAEKNRFQIYYSKAELKALGISKGQFNKLSLHSLSNLKLNNLTVKIANYTTTNQYRLYNAPEAAFDTYYNSDYYMKDGWNDIVLLKSFDWNGFSGLLLDVSFEKTKTDFNIAGIDSGAVVTASGDDKYFQFDGKNDYVYLGSMPELNGKSQFTFETWFKVDEWKNWAQLFGNGKTQIEFGDAIGDLYLEVRPIVNSYAKLAGAIKVGAWYHIAMVFNGNAINNSDRVKLFLNGEQQSLTFTKAQLPEKTSSEDAEYTFSHLTNQSNSFKGGINESRIWNYALSDLEIQNRFTKEYNATDFDKSKLIAYHAPIQNTGEYLSKDNISITKKDGVLVGVPTLESIPAAQMHLNQSKIQFRPSVKFIKGDFTSTFENYDTLIVVAKEPSTLIKYKVENYRVVPESYEYVWAEPYNYTYIGAFAIDSLKSDSSKAEGLKEFYNTKFNYYQKPVERKDVFEIGRFITPYGINLDLGPSGFCWTYDVTDYADLLKGDVELNFGNQQELIDVKFIFIKGTAPRTIIKRDKIWGNFQDVSYASLSNDLKMNEKWLMLDQNAKQFKIKTRLTGHGHQSNNGSAPWCCEWKDNEHYLYVNNLDAATWHIWQTLDCGTNPVYPQGGTWPHAREGWCPGDQVKDYDFEVTKFVKKDSVLIDYDISKVPENNLNMGNGNYIANFEFLQFSDFAFDTDAEVYDVVAPSNNQYYQRKNPICSPPIIKVRNNGSNEITSLKITYHVSGGNVATFNWARKAGLPPHSIETIELPIPEAIFWNCDGKKYFYATVSEVNGAKDQNGENDTYISTYNMPDVLGVNPIIVTQTNLRGADFSFKVYDYKGKVVLDRPSLYNSFTYTDTLRIPEGCYTLELSDQFGYGLSYWAYKEQGNGAFRILDNKGKIIKSFNPDFGFGIKYSFYVGNYNYVEDNNFSSLIDIYPNPTSDIASFKSKFDIGLAEVSITDINGNVILKDKLFINNGTEKEYSLSHYSSGLYYFNIKNEFISINKKFIKE